MLRLAGDTQQSSRVLESAAALAQARDITEPKLAAYLNRSSAVVADALGQQSEGLERLSTSAAMFAHAAPGSRAYAETGLLWAANQARAGQVDAALASCREAINVLRAAQAGTSAALLQPCLDLLAHQAAQESGGGQTLLAEMFAASQLAQSSLTTEQISQASARLQENARNPEVARLIRARDDARTRLSDLYESRDDLRAGPRGPRFNDQDDALSKRIAALQVEQGKLDSELQAASPNFGQLVQQVVDAKDVFAALQPGEAFAAISLTTDHGFIFLLRDGRITAATIDGGTPVFEALVKRVRASLDNVPSPPPPFDTAAAAEIYRRVLGGVAGALQGANALTVAPAGPLLSVPFDLLLTGPADPANLRAAPWLMQQMAVAHVPAAVNFVSLRRIAGTSKATRPWFGFGGFIAPTAAQARATFPVATCADTADLLTDLDPLQNAKSELAAVRQLLGASTGDQLLGRDFTLAAVKSAQLKHYRLLHFATHAFLPTELRCQNEPALVASTVPDAANMAQALLPASQLAELDLDADAVILSACNTAGPGGSGGESLSGLARSFFFAGARALLVTHWEVNDRFAAYEVALTIRNFHDTPGLGLARALAQAQHQVIDEARGDLAGQAHPFYWAAFAVIGDGIGKGNTRVSGL